MFGGSLFRVGKGLRGVNLVLEGDSITSGGFSGVDAGEAYGETALASSATGGWEVTLAENMSAAFSEVTDAETRASSVDALLSTTKRNVLSVMLGTNDIAQAGHSAATAFADLKSYCQDRQTAGWDVMVCTQLSRSGADTTIQALNSLIRNDDSFYTILIDFAAEPLLGATGAADNTTYFPDNVHPSTTARALMVPIWLAGLRVLAGHAYPTVASLEVSPSSASVDAGATQQYTVLAYDSLGNNIPPGLIDWTTTSGTITETGLLTAGSAATGQTVTATKGAVSDTSDLTVTAPAVPALVDSTIGAISGSGSTTAIDTTGANLIVVVVSHYPPSGAPSVSDNKGNSYTGLTTISTGDHGVRVFYTKPSSVGSNHIINATTYYSVVTVYAFSNIAGTPFDVENGATVGSGSSASTGSITPEDGDLLVIGITYNDGSISSLAASGFSTPDWIDASSGVNVGGAGAWKLHTTGSINPQWTWTGSTASAVTVAAFKAA